RRILVRTVAEDSGDMCLSVSDTGVGLPPDGATKLFDAFYTTKADGMGIGLSVSRSIVERHGGKIWAAPNDGPGATFSFSVPRRWELLESDRNAGAAGIPQAKGQS